MSARSSRVTAPVSPADNSSPGSVRRQPSRARQPSQRVQSEGLVPGALHVERNVLEWRFDPGGEARLPQASGYDQHVIIADHDFVTVAGVVGEQVLQAAGRDELVDPPALCGGHAQQAGCLVVDQRDPAVSVQRDHAVSDSVEHRLALLHERGDLLELEAEGAALQPSGQRD